MAGAIELLAQEIDQTVNGQIDELRNEIRERLDKLEATAQAARPLNVTSATGTNTVSGLRHPMLEEAIKSLGSGNHVALVGPPGSGKSTAARQCADALGLPYYSQSFSIQSSRMELLGYKSATDGTYQPTPFREAFEAGGLFMCDEMDAASPNVLLALNEALANGVCTFPDGVIEAGDGFTAMAGMNTYGMGADRMHSGRVQLDMASPDRFEMIPWNYDEKFELQLVAGFKFGAEFARTIFKVRELLTARGNGRELASPRATIRGCRALERGDKIETALERALSSTVSQTTIDAIKADAIKAWKAQTKAVKAGSSK